MRSLSKTGSSMASSFSGGLRAIWKGLSGWPVGRVHKAPRLMRMVSPGSPTTRLMKLIAASPGKWKTTTSKRSKVLSAGLS